MTGVLSVLYVDDDPDIRMIGMLSLALDPGLTVRCAASGAETLDLLAAEPDWLPDVALLDVMMPEMGGTELAAAIRARPGLESLPILFMTARAREADIQSFVAIGAADVIAKPFDPLGLAEEVRRRLARMRQS